MPQTKKAATAKHSAGKNKKASVGYREGSIIANLFNLLATGGKEYDIKELAKLVGKGKSIAAPLARLERHGKTGKMLRRWTLIRKDHTVRLTMTGKKPAASATESGAVQAPATGDSNG